jgi:hypothetical protein
MKSAKIAILLGLAVVTTLATTAAHAASKNNPAIEACFNIINNDDQPNGFQT